MMKYFKLVIFIVAVLTATTAFLNFGYWQKQASFVLQPASELKEVKNVAATGTPSTIIIPSLKISAPIIYPAQNTEYSFQQALQNGVAHYPGTAEPGQFGNCYIFGHSSDYPWSKGKYKNVFALLPKIKIGAEIIISDKAGNKFVYTVTKTVVASPKDLQYLDQGGNLKKILTLQTSYPVGTALKRWIVIAELKN